METLYRSLVSSNEYPLNENSLPQIKDFRCGVGDFYIHAYYPDSAYRKPKLRVTGIVDNAGIDWNTLWRSEVFRIAWIIALSIIHICLFLRDLLQGLVYIIVSQ